MKRKIKHTFSAYVLVVDDDYVSREVAKEILETFGCGVDTARNGYEALEKCGEIVHDIIFMDIAMPDMDGLEVTRKIREGETEDEQRQIVGLSANICDKEAVDNCLNSGMNDCIAKPITFAILEPRLEAWNIRKIYRHNKIIQGTSFGVF